MRSWGLGNPFRRNYISCHNTRWWFFTCVRQLTCHLFSHPEIPTTDVTADVWFAVDLLKRTSILTKKEKERTPFFLSCGDALMICPVCGALAAADDDQEWQIA